MTALNSIPKLFKIAGTEIKVEILDDSTCGNDEDKSFYGEWCDPINTIRIYRKIKFEGKEIVLTEEQIMNTWYHELFHCFSFFAGMSQDEMVVQVFANFMRELEQTRV